MGPTGRELYSNWQNDRAVVLPPANPLPWFAVVIKPQHERAVQDGLCQKGLESFLPTYCAARRWSDRVKRLQLPLFPGYVFCRFEYGQRLPVLRTPGVRSIVSFGPEIIPVPNDDIDRIRRMVISGCGVARGRVSAGVTWRAPSGCRTRRTGLTRRAVPGPPPGGTGR